MLAPRNTPSAFCLVASTDHWNCFMLSVPALTQVYRLTSATRPLKSITKSNHFRCRFLQLLGSILGAFWEQKPMKMVAKTHFEGNCGTCVPIDKYHTQLKVGPLKMELKIRHKSLKNLTELWYAFFIEKVSQKWAQEGSQRYQTWAKNRSVGSRTSREGAGRPMGVHLGTFWEDFWDFGQHFERNFETLRSI